MKCVPYCLSTVVQNTFFQYACNEKVLHRVDRPKKSPVSDWLLHTSAPVIYESWQHTLISSGIVSHCRFRSFQIQNVFPFSAFRYVYSLTDCPVNQKLLLLSWQTCIHTWRITVFSTDFETHRHCVRHCRKILCNALVLPEVPPAEAERNHRQK